MRILLLSYSDAHYLTQSTKEGVAPSVEEGSEENRMSTIGTGGHDGGVVSGGATSDDKSNTDEVCLDLIIHYYLLVTYCNNASYYVSHTLIIYSPHPFMSHHTSLYSHLTPPII